MWVLMSLPQVGLNASINQGTQRRQWQPHVVVVVVDGGGERRDGTFTMCDMSDISTIVA
jgi:hypothetical protein